MPVLDDLQQEAEERRVQKARESEIRRAQEEEQKREEEERQRAQNFAREQAKEYAKRRLKQELLKRAGKKLASGAAKKIGGRVAAQGLRALGAAIIESVGAALAAAAPFIGIALLILLIVALVIFVTVVVIDYLCNSEGLIGPAAQLGSAALGALGLPGGDWCEAVSGLTGAASSIVNRGQNAMCTNTQIIAQQYQTPYPNPQNDPDLDEIIRCIQGRVANVGSVYTFEVANSFCNYSRGASIYEETCGKCAHEENSCHYGGSVSAGTQGSLAVDFGGNPGAGNEGTIGPQILQAAQLCSQSLGIPLKRSTCENTPQGDAVACADPGANHVHISLGKCDRDNGPINTK